MPSHHSLSTRMILKLFIALSTIILCDAIPTEREADPTGITPNWAQERNNPIANGNIRDPSNPGKRGLIGSHQSSVQRSFSGSEPGVIDVSNYGAKGDLTLTLTLNLTLNLTLTLTPTLP